MPVHLPGTPVTKLSIIGTVSYLKISYIVLHISVKSKGKNYIFEADIILCYNLKKGILVLCTIYFNTVCFVKCKS